MEISGNLADSKSGLCLETCFDIDSENIIILNNVINRDGAGLLLFNNKKVVFKDLILFNNTSIEKSGGGMYIESTKDL